MKNIDFVLSWTDFNNNFLFNENRFYFVLLLKGELKIIADQVTYNYSENDFFTVNSNIDRNNIIAAEKTLAYVFSIDWGKLVEIIDYYEDINCSSKNISSAQAKTLLNDLMLLSFSMNLDSNSILVESNLLKFLYDLYKTNESIIPIGTNNNLKYISRIKQIKSYLYKNYSESVNLNDLADYLYLTPQYVSKFIKDHFKITFQNLLVEIRLNKAIELLKNETYTITRIAYNCGFTNLQSFNNSFKKKYGKSPSKYRENHSDNQTNKTIDIYLSNNIINDKNAEKELSNFYDKMQNHMILFSELFDIQDQVDIHETLPLSKPWQEIVNLGFANDILNSTFENHIKFVQNDLHYKYGRIQGILDAGFIPYVEETHRFNFTNLYRVIDSLISMNLIPFIEMGNKPKKINIEMNKYTFKSEVQSTYRNIDEWQYFLSQFIVDFINRYGSEEIAKWKFELWLPHDQSLNYTSKSIESYIQHYQILFITLKTRIPNIKIGGIGYNAAANIAVIKKILDTLKSEDLYFDFFTFETFFVLDDENRIPCLTSDQFYLSNIIKNIKKEMNPYKLPLVLSEYTFDVSSRNYIHDSVFQAIFVIENVLRNYQELDAIGYWNLSDLTSEYQDISKPLFGGNGMITTDGIPKPVFFANRFLSTLGSNLISQSDSHILTSKGIGSYQLLLHNYLHPSIFSIHKFINDISPDKINTIFNNPSDKTYSLTLSNLIPGKYRVKIYILNERYGSVIDEWCKLGIDIPIGSSEINYLKSKSIPFQTVNYYNVENELKLEGTILPNEVILCRIRYEI